MRIILFLGLLALSFLSLGQGGPYVKSFHEADSQLVAHSTAYLDYWNSISYVYDCFIDTTTYSERYQSFSYWGTERVVPFPNEGQCRLASGGVFGTPVSPSFPQGDLKVKRLKVQNATDQLCVTISSRTRGSHYEQDLNRYSRMIDPLKWSLGVIILDDYSYKDLKRIFDTLTVVDSRIYSKGGGVFLLEYKCVDHFFRLTVRPLRTRVFVPEEQTEWAERMFSRYQRSLLLESARFDRMLKKQWRDRKREYKEATRERYKLLKSYEMSPQEKEMTRVEWEEYALNVWLNEQEVLLRSKVRNDILLRYLKINDVQILDRPSMSYRAVQGASISDSLGVPKHLYCVNIGAKRLLPLSVEPDWLKKLRAPHSTEFIYLAILADGTIAITPKMSLDTTMEAGEIEFKLFDARMLSVNALMRITGLDLR